MARTGIYSYLFFLMQGSRGLKRETQRIPSISESEWNLEINGHLCIHLPTHFKSSKHLCNFILQGNYYVQYKSCLLQKTQTYTIPAWLFLLPSCYCSYQCLKKEILALFSHAHIFVCRYLELWSEGTQFFIHGSQVFWH